MHEMANTYPFAGLTKEALAEQTKLFTQYVRDEIARDNFKTKIGDLESRIRLVHYDGKNLDYTLDYIIYTEPQK